jgi:hypothetical protein
LHSMIRVAGRAGRHMLTAPPPGPEVADCPTYTAGREAGVQ